MTAKREVILAIDEGTSGTRAAVVGTDGRVSCLEYMPLQVHSPCPGVVEQDADAILASTLTVCRATLARAQADGLVVVGVGIATQRATAVLWDTQTGRALVPAMVWQDARYAEALAQLGRHWDDQLLARIGRPAGVRSPYLWAAHQLRHSPAVQAAYQEKRLAFGTIDSWLLWHLSTEQLCVTTPTNATSASAYLLKDHAYYLDWLAALDFPSELLPTLRQDADDFGRTRVALLGIDVPILASAGDQLAGAIGLGCLEHGQSMCVHGTGSFVDLLIGTELPQALSQHAGTLVMTARRQHEISHFSLETFVATTGSALNWVCEKLRWFDHPKQISQQASTVSSAQGITFIPALTGLRVPQMQPNARAALTGISSASTQAQVAYAILQGVAHSVTSCIQANQQVAKIDVSELVVGGGLASSDTLLQIQADLSGLPVRRVQESDRASLRGVAFLAGSSGLLWDSLAQACATTVTEAIFVSSITSTTRQQQREQWHARVAAELEYASKFETEDQKDVA